MIFFRPGSQLHRLITVLAVTGVFPVSSLHLFGNQRSMRDLITRLTVEQDYRNTETGETLHCHMLTLIGKPQSRAVRFLRSGLPMLDWIGARAFHEAVYWRFPFSGDETHIEPLYRFAEAALMLQRAGVEIRPWKTPTLQTQLSSFHLPDEPSLYSARELKKIREGELKKIRYARLTAAVFSRFGTIPIYNTRNATMKWNGMSEFKTLESLQELTWTNTEARTIDTAILFGKSESVAMKTIEGYKKSCRTDLRLDGVYRKLCFVPLREDGIAQLRLLLLPDRNERLRSLLFEPAQRSYGRGAFEYDAIVDDAYVFCFFDGDITRLIRFRSAIKTECGRFELLCFPFQVSLVRQVLGKQVDIKILEPGLILDALGLEGGNAFEFKT